MVRLERSDVMLKSCSYCGSIHDRTHHCSSKPVYNRKRERNSDADRLRNTKAWRDRSLEIRKRDRGLCQVCIRNLYHTTTQYTFDNVSVHHIKPLHEGGSLLSGHNLLSVCRMHHNMCECGDIPRQEQKQFAKEQEQLNKL